MLYVVGTPIGNLEDLSLRQARVISESEYILSEDTRSTGILLIKIKELFPSIQSGTTPQLISYYKDNEFEKLPQILELMRTANKVSMISQAGMPLVSDPGYLLIKHMIKEGLPFEVIPGPTAAATALVYSGFNPGHHMFIGFLQKKPNDVKKQIERLKEFSTHDKNLIFVAYESPKRIQSTLEILNEIVPDVHVAVCRELTKKFEEISRGKPADLKDREYRGEITLVLSAL